MVMKSAESSKQKIQEMWWSKCQEPINIFLKYFCYMNLVQVLLVFMYFKYTEHTVSASFTHIQHFLKGTMELKDLENMISLKSLNVCILFLF